MGLLELGAKEVTLGLGGSATCDGGLGLARGLGYRFLDAEGGEIETPAAGDHAADHRGGPTRFATVVSAGFCGGRGGAGVIP